MLNFGSNSYSERIYEAAKSAILEDPINPFGKGLAEQLIDETQSLPFKLKGIGLLTLVHALRKHPEEVEIARERLK